MNEIKVGDKVFVEVVIDEKIESRTGVYYKATFRQYKSGGSEDKFIEININKYNKINPS